MRIDELIAAADRASTAPTHDERAIRDSERAGAARRLTADVADPAAGDAHREVVNATAADGRHVRRSQRTNARPPIPDLGTLTLLRRARDRMDREYAQPLDVPAIARGVHMSPGHFSRQFRRAYGETPYQYLMTRRIERAMALLRNSELSITEISLSVGCLSLGTFSTRFTGSSLWMWWIDWSGSLTGVAVSARRVQDGLVGGSDSRLF